MTWNAFRGHLILEYEIAKYEGDLGAPNVFSPLSQETARRKIDAILDEYATQRSKPWFSEDTFWALLRLRGIESGSSSRFAEAFTCRKMVLDSRVTPQLGEAVATQSTLVETPA